MGVKSRGGSSPLSRIRRSGNLEPLRVASGPTQGRTRSHTTIHVTLGIASLYRLPFVVLPLAGAQSDEHLHTALDEVHLQGHDGLPSLTSQIRPLSDFLFMSQKNPFSHGLVLNS